MKTALFILHQKTSEAGNIGNKLKKRGFTFDIVRPSLGEDHPNNLNKYSAIVVFGGPMSVNDELRLPWLKDEKQFVREAILRDIPVLGICLGAQLVASALGAAVYRNPTKEIGWFPIQAVSTPETVFHFPLRFSLFSNPISQN